MIAIPNPPLFSFLFVGAGDRAAAIINAQAFDVALSDSDSDIWEYPELEEAYPFTMSTKKGTGGGIMKKGGNTFGTPVVRAPAGVKPATALKSAGVFSADKDRDHHRRDDHHSVLRKASLEKKSKQQPPGILRSSRDRSQTPGPTPEEQEAAEADLRRADADTCGIPIGTVADRSVHFGGGVDTPRSDASESESASASSSEASESSASSSAFSSASAFSASAFFRLRFSAFLTL